MSRPLRVTLQGRPLTLPVRRDRRARRITIHIDAAIGGARIVMPVDAVLAEAEDAVREHQDWLLDRLDRLPPPVAFEDGAVIPLRGVDHMIVYHPYQRGVIDHADGLLHVYGHPEHMPRRIGDWLKREARRVISPMAMAKAGIVGRRVTRVAIRDQRSRWGSCSEKGGLSFNWRLILAPESVLDYVVAHEVAHLVEMNHSPAFWRVVDRLTPHARAARRWLNANGNGLHRYG